SELPGVEIRRALPLEGAPGSWRGRVGAQNQLPGAGGCPSLMRRSAPLPSARARNARRSARARNARRATTTPPTPPRASFAPPALAPPMLPPPAPPSPTVPSLTPPRRRSEDRAVLVTEVFRLPQGQPRDVLLCEHTPLALVLGNQHRVGLAESIEAV